MNEINFFESYIEKKQFKLKGELIYFTVAMLLVLLILLNIIIDQMRIRSVLKDIAKFKTILEDEYFIQKRDEILAKETEIKEYKEYLEKLKKLDIIVEEDSIIDDYLLDNITSRIPEDMFLTSVSIYIDHLELTGVSDNKHSIAEFGENMQSIIGFKDVFITSISREDYFYRFIINAIMKEVKQNGENEPIEEDRD